MSALDRIIDDIATVALARAKPEASKADITRMKNDLNVREEAVSGLFSMIFENLPAEKAEEFEEALESGDEAKLDAFLKTNLTSRPDMKTLIMKTVAAVEKKLP